MSTLWNRAKGRWETIPLGSMTLRCPCGRQLPGERVHVRPDGMTFCERCMLEEERTFPVEEESK